MVELTAMDIVGFLILLILAILQLDMRIKMKRNNRGNQGDEDTTVTGSPSNPGPEGIPGKAKECIQHGIKLGELTTKVNGLCTQMNRLLNNKK